MHRKSVWGLMVGKENKPTHFFYFQDSYFYFYPFYIIKYKSYTKVGFKSFKCRTYFSYTLIKNIKYFLIQLFFLFYEEFVSCNSK